MSPALAQDLIVSAIALVAALLIGRRLVGFIRPKQAGTSACARCAAGQPCTPNPAVPSAPPNTPIPMDLLRRPNRL